MNASLADRYLQLCGLAEGLDRAIHPDDEMFRYIASRVAADQAELHYLRSGREVLSVIENVLDRCAKPLGECQRVLDFACGWGRLTRFLCRQLGADRISAADIAPGATSFVTTQFGAHGFVSTRNADALPPMGKFDLIWVGSLFSHLPLASFRSWLTRLWSMVADDGLLLFSTHGARAAPQTPRHASGFTFVEQSETHGRLSPEDYGTAYIDESAMREMGRELGLPELGWVEAELWSNQDLWVARRREAVPPVIEPAAMAIGRIEKAWWPRPSHAWVGGSVRLPAREGKPVIELLLDGHKVAECRLSEGYAYPHPGTITPAMQYFQWYTEGPVADQPSDVAVVARSASGMRTVIDVTRLTAS